jgi:NADH-quinone oxidoreductase subunit E
VTSAVTSGSELPENFRTTVMKLERAGDASVFGPDVRAAAQELIDRYPPGQGRSALLPLLHLVQSEQGYVSPDGIAFCADMLDLAKAQVAAVATFYTMYKREPVGEFIVSVCTNTLCAMLGGDEVYAALSEHLGVGMNQTTSDGRITLEHAECLAACDYAPVVTVNYEFFDNQTVQSATGLVDALRAGVRPEPTRGAPLCTFKQIERQIAGFFDERPEALEASGTGPPTERGVKLAVRRNESAPSYSTTAGPAPAKAVPATTAPAKAAPAKAAPAKAAPAAAAPAAASAQPTSAHDAPLQTHASDPAHDSGEAD